jgi:hypothetical protein
MATRIYPLTLIMVVGVAGLAHGAEVRGVIGKLDNEKKELLVDLRGVGLRGTSMTFGLAPDVKITVGDKPGTMADLATGKRVRVTYEEQNGKRVATSVHVVAILQTLQGLSGLLPAPGPGPAPAPQAAPAAPAPVPGVGMTGTLRRVAATEREIIVATPGEGGQEKYTTLAVPEDAAISRDGKAVKLDDLKEGESVFVRSTRKDGKLAAVTIEAGKRSPAAAAPAAGPDQGSSKIATVRQVLQMIDQALQQLEKRQDK